MEKRYMIDVKKALDHFQVQDPKIFTVLKQINFSEWFEDRKPEDRFKSLVSSIISQQLSGKAANTIKNRVLNLMPSHEFTPKDILSVEQDLLRSAGMAWAKVRSIQDLSQKVLSGELELHALENMTDEDVIASLTKVKGIGRWTAEMFLIFSLAREDVFSFGDVGLKNGLCLIYNLENPSIAQIEKIITPWKPYRSIGSIALWHALDSK